MENTNNYFDGSVGYIKVTADAVADGGTLTVDMSKYPNAGFVIQAIDDSGDLTVPSASTFTVAYNTTTNVLTITNVTGSPYTGTFVILAVV
jgi:hypothetical protein